MSGRWSCAGGPAPTWSTRPCARRRSCGRTSGRAVPPKGSFSEIQIVGGREMRRALKRMDKQLVKDLNSELKAATEPIVQDARQRYYRFYRRRKGRSPKGMRAKVSRGGAAVALGGKRYPYLAGQEWGASGGRYSQFPRRQQGGRFFWPALMDGMSELKPKVERIIGRSARRAGFR